MEILAKDIMIREVEEIKTDTPIKKAVYRIFHGKIRDTGHKTVSLIVTDDFGKLVGVISLFDILYHFRPEFLNYGLETVEKWSGRLMPLLDEFKNLTVEQVMSSPVMTVGPDDHLMVIIDIMVKKKLRRLPVVENDKVLGVVYLYDVYYHLFKNWLKKEFGK
ncbi:MAG: CBS domain-containing protein [Desulfobacterales bacterium]